MKVFRNMKNIWKSLYKKELLTYRVVIETRIVEAIRFSLDHKTRLRKWEYSMKNYHGEVKAL